MRFLFVIYDNEMFTHWLPQGTAYLAAVLEQAGVDVAFWHQDINHWPAEALTEHLDADRYDAVGIGCVAGYHPYLMLLALSRAVNASKQRPFFVLGGHGPSAEPAYYLRKTGADAVVCGEGEETLPELLDASSLERVAGTAFADYTNPRRPLIRDLDSLPRPAYHLLPMKRYRLLRGPGAKATDFCVPMLTGRGCTFRCNFCYRLDKGHRTRSPEAIRDEAAFLKTEYGVSYIIFSDELLMSSPERALAVAEAVAPLKLKWYCNGRLNYATPDVLRPMAEAGCVYINYGIESFNDDMLERMHKHLTCEQITAGVEATHEAGITPGLNMLFGQPGETLAHLERSVRFLLEHDNCSQLRTIRPVTPYPGCELYREAIEQGLLDGPEDFYERKHLNSDRVAVNFTSLSDAAFHEALLAANTRLIENFYRAKQAEWTAAAHRLYLDGDTSFRGFRQK